MGTNRKPFSDDEANDLCKRYVPLVRKIAGRYRDKGIHFGELESAGLAGLVRASRRFDPSRSVPFGGYAKPWIRGCILELFKPGKDAFRIRFAERPRLQSR